MKEKRHFTANYLLNPTHPVTINLVGCGGTGSNVVMILSRFNYALRKLGHPGLHVTIHDPDIVTEANVGRQLFAESDTGQYKACILATRVNRCFGTGWEAIPEKFNAEEDANITISCTDTAASRLEIKQLLHKNKNEDNPHLRKYYWLDFGNTQHTGQAILGTLCKIPQPGTDKYETVPRLPCITEKYDLKKVKEEDSGPSCSLAEALQNQDLLINSTLANAGCNILWKLFREGLITYHGCFMNLQKMIMVPISV